MYSREQIHSILFLTRLKATGMTIAEMKKFQEMTSSGDETIPGRLSLLEEHNRNILNEIARLSEIQKIIEFKIQNFREIFENPRGTNCTETSKEE
ncbi:hypothetical protein [Bacillus sp. FJAT-27264]|uniref:hypothetical protein n=1 Tax=Paenibacillus sp. (strain DSM 101736 / FJAT-27264) TaxID=1850362 RepID=UPI0025708546|nr:hypothetical protein [Bacillus sp. FJAT-27264]